MRKMRKIAAVVLALVVCLAMSLPVMAAPDGYDTGVHTIKITSKENNDVYEAYQVFAGKEYEETLSDVTWGANIDKTREAEIYAALSGEPTFGELFNEVKSAADVAQALGNVAVKMNAEQTKKFADIINEYLIGVPCSTSDGVEGPSAENIYTYTINGLSDGYYLVKDKDGSVSAQEAYTDFILQVVDDVDVAAKSEVPSVDKNITGEVGNGFESPETGKADELAIGDIVEYELTSAVPSNAADYDEYFFVLRDTLSAGLTLQDGTEEASYTDYKKTGVQIDPEGTSIVVKAGNDELNLNDNYTLKVEVTSDGSTSIIVALKNAAVYAGKPIVVTYAAKLNENAKIGATGNDNKVDLLFSNNPNTTYTGKDNDNDGIPDNMKDSAFGVTPESQVWTYTTGLAIQKVDENGNVLKGAAFTITGENLNVTLTSTEVFNPAPEGESGTYYKLNNGTYTTTAPRVEDQMIEKTNNRNNGYVETSDNKRDGYITVGGKGYAPANKEERDSDVTLYTLLKANADDYESTTPDYTRTVTYEAKTAAGEELNVTAEVGEDGVVRFNGLGSGNYTISETKTPDGYNTIDDIDVTIGWEAPAKVGENCKWTVTGDGFEVNEEGIITVTIENQSGSLLPETGGIGTTIFYVVGAILVIGAGVLLIARKRMGRQK